ncbi:hypothetical protein ABTM12_19585, partial [Acinetobacter baumannii]
YVELAAFRGPYLGRGIDGIKAALTAARDDCDAGNDARRQRRHLAVRRLFADDWTAAHDLIDRLALAMTPLIAAFAASAPQPLAALSAAHAA